MGGQEDEPGNPRCRVTSKLPTSTPSSKALVAATAHRSPSCSAASISRRSCIVAAGYSGKDLGASTHSVTVELHCSTAAASAASCGKYRWLLQWGGKGGGRGVEGGMEGHRGLPPLGKGEEEGRRG